LPVLPAFSCGSPLLIKINRRLFAIEPNSFRINVLRPEFQDDHQNIRKVAPKKPAGKSIRLSTQTNDRLKKSVSGRNGIQTPYPHAVVHVEVVSPDVVPGELCPGFDEPGFVVTRLGEFAVDFSPRDYIPGCGISQGFLSVEHVSADFRYRPYKDRGYDCKLS
jgi:hypothetical protein